MSIGILIKGPEGLVLAAESRITISARDQKNKREIPVSFDNAKKVLRFPAPHNYVGAVTYGLGAIGLRTAASFIPEFEQRLPENRLTILEFSNLFKDFFMAQWENAMPKDFKGPSMTFIIGGFNEGEPYGRVYLLEIPKSPEPDEKNPPPDGFGITWGGQRGIVDRLLRGYDENVLNVIKRQLKLKKDQMDKLSKALVPFQMKIPLHFLPLQDCIDLAIFFIRTTIEGQRLTVGIRGCGGPIDVATITRLQGFKFIQEKLLKGE